MVCLQASDSRGSFENFLHCPGASSLLASEPLPGETPDKNEQRFQDNCAQILFSSVMPSFLPSPAWLEFSAQRSSMRAFQSNLAIPPHSREMLAG